LNGDGNVDLVVLGSTVVAVPKETESSWLRDWGGTIIAATIGALAVIGVALTGRRKAAEVEQAIEAIPILIGDSEQPIGSSEIVSRPEAGPPP
jgi:hypothetical protein